MKAVWAVLVVVALSSSNTALAWDGGYLGSCACGSWLYPGGSAYVGQSPPYFALYPPVYYRYPIARTYGFSPFAYPPGTITPESPIRPYVVRNMYAPGVESAVAATEEPQVRPLRIRNPFVADAAR